MVIAATGTRLMPEPRQGTRLTAARAARLALAESVWWPPPCCMTAHRRPTASTATRPRGSTGTARLRAAPK
jgi:hypothetical protein